MFESSKGLRKGCVKAWSSVSSSVRKRSKGCRQVIYNTATPYELIRNILYCPYRSLTTHRDQTLTEPLRILYCLYPTSHSVECKDTWQKTEKYGEIPVAITLDMWHIFTRPLNVMGSIKIGDSGPWRRAVFAAGGLHWWVSTLSSPVGLLRLSCAVLPGHGTSDRCPACTHFLRHHAVAEQRAPQMIIDVGWSITGGGHHLRIAPCYCVALRILCRAKDLTDG